MNTRHADGSRGGPAASGRGAVVRSRRGVNGVSRAAVRATADLLTTSAAEPEESMPEPDASRGTVLESAASDEHGGGYAAVLLSGNEIFIKARTIRRVRMPASLRQGRHSATVARRRPDVLRDRPALPATS